MPPGGEAIGAGGSGGPSVDLSTAMTGEALQPILSQEGFLDKVRESSYCNEFTRFDISSQVKAFLPAGEEEGKEVTAADLKVGQLSLTLFCITNFQTQILRAQSSRLSSSKLCLCSPWLFSQAR